MRKVLAILALLLMTGCGGLWPNLKTDQDRTVKESEAGKVTAGASTAFEGPAPSVGPITTGDNSPVSVAASQPAPVRTAHTMSKSAEAASTNELWATLWLKQQNPYTLLLMGIGMALIVGVVWFVLRAILQTRTGRMAAETMDAGAAMGIQYLKNALQRETDPLTVAKLQSLVIEAQDAKGKKWDELTKK